jgi:hypothetical protein
MEPQNPQFDGQSEGVILSKIQDAADNRSTALNSAINDALKGKPMDYSGFTEATTKEYHVLAGVPTDTLVKHISTTNHSSALPSLAHLQSRTDVTPEHISQMVMHVDPKTSHMASRLPQATTEHRALHSLVHGSNNCKECKNKD